MSEVKRGKGLYSALAYLPVVVPPVVAVLLWKVFYDASPTGVFNTILGWVGIPPQPWLQIVGDGDAVARARGDLGGGRRLDHHLPRGAASACRPSSTTPPRSTAPAIWHKIWHVTLPQLRGILFIMLILQVIATAQVFLEPFLFTGGGPNNATVTILLLIYRYAFQNSLGGDYGEATALSLMLAIFLGAAELAVLQAHRTLEHQLTTTQPPRLRRRSTPPRAAIAACAASSAAERADVADDERGRPRHRCPSYDRKRGGVQGSA